MKTFGPTQPRAIRRESFTLNAQRGKKIEPHIFTALLALDAGPVGSTMHALKHEPDQAVTELLRAVGKMLADDDGTPENWRVKFVDLDQPDEVEPGPDGQEVTLTAWAEDQPVNQWEDIRYIEGVDGEPVEYSADLVEKLTDVAAGSSRRRWWHLMDVDHNATVDIVDVRNIWEWLVSLAAERPTRPSASSRG